MNSLPKEQLMSIVNGNSTVDYKTHSNRSAGRRMELVTAADIRSERIQWLWEPRIPLRGLTILCGEKGRGKSLLANALLPALATRGNLPGELHGIPTDVLVCTAEDDWRSIVKPRLAAAGADLTRVHQPRINDEHGESLMTLPDDVALLEENIQRLRDDGRTVGLLVIDPIGAFLSQDIDSHRDASVRRALAPVAQMAERLDVAVLVVAHLTKDESGRMINRVNGAGAFVNAARSVLALAPDPGDPDGDDGDHRVLVHVRGNWGRLSPTLSAQVGDAEIMLDDGTPTKIGRLRITGESDITVEDLQGRKDETSRDEVEETLLAALADGEKPSREVKAQVRRETSCSDSTVKRAAARLKERGDLVQDDVGYPRRTVWRLSRATDQAAKSAAYEHPDPPDPTDPTAVFTGDSGPSPLIPLQQSGQTPKSQRRLVGCCCADGGIDSEDGRCGRCYGERRPA
jgi:hypothetical protein